MRERNYKGFLIFDIDNNGDNYESFQKAVKLFREKYDIREIKYYSGFFDDAEFHFIIENINLKIDYSGFMGTELKAIENITLFDLQKVRQWAEEIYKAIHMENPR